MKSKRKGWRRLAELKIKDSEIEESQKAIDSNIERINENILFIADLSRGDLERVTNFDLAEHLRRECRLLETRSRADGIQLVVRAPQNQKAVISKPGFSMVLLDLWENALHAVQAREGDKERKIAIELSSDVEGHVLVVADTGMGISEDVRPNLFREFATGKTGGTGIGLHNCKLIVEAHGGSIRYETQIGQGTTFRVVFPDRNQEK